MNTGDALVIDGRSFGLQLRREHAGDRSSETLRTELLSVTQLSFYAAARRTQ
jgi:hypothetical protein